MPLPPDAPRVKLLMGNPPHPALIEVKLKKLTNDAINNHRLIKRAGDISQVLNLFLNTNIFVEDMTRRAAWVTCLEAGVDEETKVRHLFYGYKVKPRLVEEFSDVSALEPAESIKIADYYQPQNIFQDLTLPVGLDKWIEFSLRNENISEVCRLFSMVSRLWDQSHSYAYVAAISAIERLLHTTPDTCEGSGQKKYSITGKFKKFIETYGPRTYGESEEAKNKMYKIRSDILHRGHLFHFDRSAYILGATYFSNKDQNELIYVEWIVRVAIISWLTEKIKIE